MEFIYFGLVLFSFFANSLLFIPFINLLYRWHFVRRRQITRDFQNKRAVIFDKLHAHKAGTPVGGGLLMVITILSLQFVLLPVLKIYRHRGFYTAYPLVDEANIVFFTMISFGVLGLYDDLMKFFGFEKTGFFGLRMRHKFLLQWALAFIVAAMLYFNLGINFIYLPFYRAVYLGYGYIFLAATLIVWLANAFNITDGLDGLSNGLLLIFLLAFWVIAFQSFDTFLGVFIALWVGAVLAFLYFNVAPARLTLGDIGALAFGATIAVIGLLTGKIVAVLIVGMVFNLEGLSSLLQILSKAWRHRKIFPAAPLHLWLQYRGWPETKIVMRAWIVGIVFAFLGLWLSFI